MTGPELVVTLTGGTFLALGSMSAFTATLRLQRGAITLLTFGLFCVLYGVRLLATQDAVQAAIGMTEIQGVWVSA